MNSSTTLLKPKPVLQKTSSPIIQIPSKHYKSVPLPTTQPRTNQQRSLKPSASLERRFQRLDLNQKRIAQRTRKRAKLECLRVSKIRAGQFWIIERGSRKPFVRAVFDTSKYCWECCLELEATFDIQQVIEQRPTEAMERIAEMVGDFLDRERVALSWG